MFLLLIAMLLLAACGGSNSGAMEVTDVWGRSSPMAATNGAFYMQITNSTGQDDSLVGATTDACGTVELHEMYMKENDVMGMREVPGGSIPLPDGEMVELKVGGLHVMCIGKTREFNTGDTIPVTLEFAQAGTMDVTAEIRDTADMPGMGNGG